MGYADHEGTDHMNQTWRYDEDRTYRGYRKLQGTSLIDVELAEYGPTQRTGALVIKTISSGSGGIFTGLELNWGFNGTGTSVAAYEVLADALGEPATDELREAFCEDVLSQLGPEWRLRRGAVLRWALGWGVQHGKVGELPDILRALPPVEPEDFEPRPQHVREASDQKRRASEAG